MLKNKLKQLILLFPFITLVSCEELNDFFEKEEDEQEKEEEVIIVNEFIKIKELRSPQSAGIVPLVYSQTNNYDVNFEFKDGDVDWVDIIKFESIDEYISKIKFEAEKNEVSDDQVDEVQMSEPYVMLLSFKENTIGRDRSAVLYFEHGETKDTLLVRQAGKLGDFGVNITGEDIDNNDPKVSETNWLSLNSLSYSQVDTLNKIIEDNSQFMYITSNSSDYFTPSGNKWINYYYSTSMTTFNPQDFSNCPTLKELVLPDITDIEHSLMIPESRFISKLTIATNSDELKILNGHESPYLEEEEFYQNIDLTITPNQSVVLSGLNIRVKNYDQAITFGPFKSINGSKNEMVSNTLYIDQLPDDISKIEPGDITILDEEILGDRIQRLTDVLGQNAFDSGVAWEDQRQINLIFPNLKYFAGEDSNFSIGNITSIDVPKLQILGEGFAEGNKNIVTINAPSATDIYEDALRGCEKLKELNAPLVTSISKNALDGCSSLTKLHFPVLEVAHENAFTDCSSLESVDLGTESTSLKFNYSAFENVDMSKIKLKTGLSNGTAVEGLTWRVPLTTPHTVQFEKLTEIVLGPFNEINDFTQDDLVKGPLALADIPEFGTMIYGDTWEISDVIGISGVDSPSGNGDGQFAKLYRAIESAHRPITLVFNSITDLPRGAFHKEPVGSERQTINRNLKKVIAPKVLRVGDEAFSCCKGLKEVELPEATTIGYKAFEYSAIDSISLPKAVNLGEELFTWCDELQSVSLPMAQTIEERMFYASGIKSVKSTDFPKVTTIKQYAFSECKNLENVSINSAIEGERNIFTGCEKLVSAELNNLKELIYGYQSDETEMFEGCVKLTDISLPKLQNLGSFFLKGCTSIETINLPEVIIVGYYSFNDCFNLKSISLPNATYIGSHAFVGCSKLESIHFPNAKTICEKALSRCDILKSVSAPKLIKIEDGAFDESPYLNTLSIAHTSTSFEIGANTFTNVATERITLRIGGNTETDINTEDNIWTVSGQAINFLDIDIIVYKLL